MEVGVRRNGRGGKVEVVMADEALGCVLKYIGSPVDRASVSLVCQQWRRVDGMTRKAVTVANMYAVKPAALTGRFTRLPGFKLKGKPRASEFGLLVSNWGGYAEPWLKEVGGRYENLQSLVLRRVVVEDSDLELIASSAYRSVLQVLCLHKCEGFTTTGLLPIAQSCLILKKLSLEDSEVVDEGGEWLHALALYNSTLEELHFGVLGLGDIDVADLVSLVKKCKSLVSLKMGEIEMLDDMADVLNGAPHLEEFGAGSYNYLSEGGEDAALAVPIPLPRRLKSLSGMWSLADAGLSTILPVAANLRILDLKYTHLSCESHIQLLSQCHLLEELQTRNTLGDEGMETIARSCKELQKLRVEDDETGGITQRGLVAVAQGCGNLVQLIVFVASISNAALAMIGHGCPRLTDFRIVLEPIPRPGYDAPDFPLDDGLKLLLKGCSHLTRMAFYQRHGCLTDRGLKHIGTYGHNLKWLLIGCTGESDIGLANLAHLSQRIQRLEIRDCPFEGAGLVAAVATMSSLKYLWVHAPRADLSSVGKDLVNLARPGLTVEVCPPPPGQPGLQLFAYYSLAGPRTDIPPELQIFTTNPRV